MQGESGRHEFKELREVGHMGLVAGRSTAGF